jgi:hypothetical protein
MPKNEKKNMDPVESSSRWLSLIISVFGLLTIINQWSFANNLVFKIILNFVFIVFAVIGIVRPIYRSSVKQKSRLSKVGYFSLVACIFVFLTIIILTQFGKTQNVVCLRVPSTKDISRIKDSIPDFTTAVSLEAAVNDSCGMAFRDQLFIKLMASGYENLSVTTITNQEDYFKGEPYTILKINAGNTPQIIITINPENH